MKTFPGMSLASIWSIVAVCMLLLTGCQVAGERAAGTDPTPAATSINPTPTAVPVYKPADASGRAQNVRVPVKPALADVNSKEGLEAFTAYWYELLTYGYESGDTGPWNAATETGCALCETLTTGLAESYAEERWLVGGRLTTPSIEADWKDGEDTQSVAVQVIQGRIEFYGPANIQPFPPLESTNVTASFFAKHFSGHWTVIEVGHLV
ncbi:DUF6318 family protein [Pseudarthrobacter sp. J64]|uniref:DUF6318 family protein n=1 Tax=Pseudarthrobacter sp. J64 TaxID=3116485 RepID=UPI002E8147E5|nr:DUF6318 family protein [Pseudarthrobacter sp. J64]MEE2570706.1 DUF6318 family protein [Pseudarthrobacter sp. J64]